MVSNPHASSVDMDHGPVTRGRMAPEITIFTDPYGLVLLSLDHRSTPTVDQAPSPTVNQAPSPTVN